MRSPTKVVIPVDVSKAAQGQGRVVATVFLPDRVPSAPTLMFALPGGGYARGYFDLRFDGHAGYSQAEHHVARGIVLVAMDHLGVGESSTGANDVLTIEDIAAANDQAVREILVRLRAGTLVTGEAPIEPGFVVGTGQSMGGGVTIIMQGRHRTYDAIAPLGYSPVHTSLPQRRPEMREAIKAVFAGFSRATPPQDLSVPHSSEQIPDFQYPFHCEDVPHDILQADMAGGYPLRQSPPSWGSATVPRCVVAMMSPGYVAEEAAAIDVPVFLGFGERDVSEAPHREPVMFPRVRDITVYVAPRMAHMHNFASTRALLWDRTLDWLTIRRTRRRVALLTGLPVAFEQITPAWLTGALRPAHPGVSVRAVSVGDAMHGTATKVRVRPTYDGAADPDGLPSTLIVKGGFSAHRELMYREYMLESRFYSELAPRLREMRVPRSIYAEYDDAQRQAIVILNDLDAEGVTFCRVQQPLSYEQAAAQLDTLASLHAQWWESDEFEDGAPLDWIDALDPLPEGVLGTYQRSRLQPEVYAGCMALPRGVAVSRAFHDRDRMERAMEHLRALDRVGPKCLLHSDPHLGNWYLDRDGRPGLLDWQSMRKGPWSHDFNYCLVSSLDMLDRRAWERALLQHYLDALRARGVTSPAFDDAWQAYRAQTVYGLYYWLVNPVEFQVEVNNCAVAARFAFAAIDHDTFGLLLG